MGTTDSQDLPSPDDSSNGLNPIVGGRRGVYSENNALRLVTSWFHIVIPWSEP